MITLFNILIIGLVLLIAYWWANQGLFSAIMHLVAVIAAGAIAFAVWEPLSLLMLNGGGFDGYAWGVVLVGVFAFMLAIIRFAFDRIAPANVDMPHWANLACGFPVGAAAGTLTMGMFIIGAGHVQSQNEIMGLVGYARSERTGQIEQINSLWVPVHSITADFYSWLSATAFWAPTSLREANPQLDRQSVSLIRDSYRDGRGAIAMPPEAVTVQGWQRFPAQTGEVQVALKFGPKAVDYNEQLTLSAAQVRLIGWPESNFAEAAVAHPFGWEQQGTRYQFNSVTYYATSTPGQESADITFFFNVSQDFRPRFIQVRGTRYTLGPSQAGGPGGIAAADRPDIDRSAPSIDSAVEVTNRIRPILAGVNNLPTAAQVETVDDRNYLYTTNGQRAPFRSRERASSSLAVRGLYAPVGTKVVQVNAGPQSPAYIFRQSILNQLNDDSMLRLVDTDGNTYSCIGYLQVAPDNTAIVNLDPNNFVRRLGDLVQLPPGSEDELRLVFRVTEAVTIEALMFGDVTVGTCNVYVDPEARR